MMTDKTKKYLKNTLKLVVSVCALLFVFSKVNLSAVWQIVAGISWTWLVLALVAYTLSQLLSSERVRGMLLAVPIDISFPVNLKLYWLGMFYNFFLPGGIGGDGYKVYWLHKRKNVAVRPVVMSLLGDRLSGLLAICVYTVGYFAVRHGLAAKLGLSFNSLWALALIPIGVFAYWSFFRIFQSNLSRASLVAAGRSLVVQGFQMLAATLILVALGHGGREAVGDYLFLFLLSSVASAVPITLAGVGVREVAFVVGSRFLDTNQDVAVSLSLVFYIVSFVSALPGLVFAVHTSLIDGGDVPEPEVTPSMEDVLELETDDDGSENGNAK